MSKLTIWSRAWAVLALVTLTASAWGGGAPLGYVRTHTLQNLAPNPSKFTGHYLAIDDAGATVLSKSSHKWEFKYYFWKERGYQTHTIIQRGDNPDNGKYLCILADGTLGYSKDPIPTARWLVRYAGKFHGWDSFQIQNLADGPLGMSYLAIDEVTGEVVVTAKPIAGSNWFMNDSPYLPAETFIP